MYEAGLTYALFAGFMSVLLILHSVEKKNEPSFVFALVFLISPGAVPSGIYG